VSELKDRAKMVVGFGGVGWVGRWVLCACWVFLGCVYMRACFRFSLEVVISSDFTILLC
jgi:hypothetical protein